MEENIAFFESLAENPGLWPAELGKLHGLLKEATDAAGQLAVAERARKLREAYIRLDESIDGRNAEVREAQFTILCSKDQTLQDCISGEDDCQAELSLYRAEIEVLRLELSFMKRQADLQIQLARAEDE